MASLKRNVAGLQEMLSEIRKAKGHLLKELRLLEEAETQLVRKIAEEGEEGSSKSIQAELSAASLATLQNITDRKKYERHRIMLQSKSASA